MNLEKAKETAKSAKPSATTTFKLDVQPVAASDSKIVAPGLFYNKV
jgi:hypothetical protein